MGLARRQPCGLPPKAGRESRQCCATKPTVLPLDMDRVLTRQPEFEFGDKVADGVVRFSSQIRLMINRLCLLDDGVDAPTGLDRRIIARERSWASPLESGFKKGS